MIIEVKTVTAKSGSKRFKTRKVLVFQCDTCGIVKEKQFKQSIIDNFISGKSLYMYCGRECYYKGMSKNGVGCEDYQERRGDPQEWYKKAQATLQKNYGVDHPMQSQEIQDQYKLTCLRNHGVEWPMKSEKVRELSKLTCIEKYGHEYYIRSEVGQRTSKETLQKNYGVDTPFKSLVIQERSKQTCLDRYGFTNAMKSNEVLERMFATNLRLYGVRTPMERQDVVDNFDWELREIKRKQTLRERGHLKSSNDENKFYDCVLVPKFGIDDIQRHVEINGHDIDFYVKSIDTYIQHDGVYYHGLDRTIKEIMQFKKRTDEVIFSTILRDLIQNEWFKWNNMKLVRVTDKEWKTASAMGWIDVVVERIRST